MTSCNYANGQACGAFGGRPHQSGPGCPTPFEDAHFDAFMAQIREMVIDLLTKEREAERDRAKGDSNGFGHSEAGEFPAGRRND